jgi:hypothetical protein
MLIVRRSLLVSSLLFAAACGGADAIGVTAPTSTGPRPVARLIRVSETASPDAPADSWMGDTLRAPVAVRVVDAVGAPVAGVAVRFASGDNQLAFIADASTPCLESTSAPDASLTCVVLSDANGIAAAGAVRAAISDTASRTHRLEAQLVAGDSARVAFAIRSWRNLSRFGGDAPVVFAALPVSREHVVGILPLGTFGTDDALPSADSRILLRAGSATDVRAMADALITDVDAVANSITMRVRNGVRVRYANVALRADLWAGQVIRAGERLGDVSATGLVEGLRIRVMDAATQRTRWIRAERYGALRTTGFFVRYLADDIRSDAFGLVRRAAPDLDGRIDYDKSGRLVGTWFDASAMAASSAATVGANAFARAALRPEDTDPSESLSPVALTMAYDAEHPGQVRVALGGALGALLGLRGVHAVSWDDPDPAEVDASRGVVRYRLYATDDVTRLGQASRTLLVQLIGDDQLRVEVADGDASSRAEFSARALILVR